MFPVVLETRLFGLLSEPWVLHSYGLLIASGFLLAMLLAARAAKRAGEDPDRIIDLGFYSLLFGLVGARLVFILARLADYRAHPLQIVEFWQGGLVWYGGFLGAAAYLVYTCRKHRHSFWRYADLMIVPLALAHAFGRVGCFLAGCCHGRPTTMPWGVVFPIASLAHRAQQSAGLVGFSDPTLPVHPTQLYEAAVELALFVGLTLMRSRKHRDGQLFLLWLMIYAAARAIIEMFRGDALRGVYFLSTSQYISLAAMMGVLALAIYRRRHPTPQSSLDMEDRR